MSTLTIELGSPKTKPTGSIMDRVKTFDDACRACGISPDQSLTIESEALKKDLKSIGAYAKLIIIARALNEGWEPDWANTDQKKWTPWFTLNAGFGFSFTYYVNWRTNTHVGSRLCFRSQELAEYAGKQFEDIYNDYITL
jgi:hypothetical protein